MYSKIFVSALFVILVSSGSRRTNAGPLAVPPALIYRPSIAELSVPFRENPKILLSNFPGRSVVLNLLNGHPSASNYLVHLARQAGNSDAGSFTVEAPKDHGIMAVIQRLHLRRISDTSTLLQLENNCKDYLQFEGRRGEKTIPICGNLDRDDRSFYPPDLHGPKFFNSPDGRIKVTFRNLFDYGNELAGENDTEKHEDSREILTVEIAFTAYAKCLTAEEAQDRFQCTVGQCIEKELVCDDVENCTPGENQRHFGVDEKNCTTNLAEVIDDEQTRSASQGHGQGMIRQDDFRTGQVPHDSSSSSNNNDPDSINYVKPPPLTTIIVLILMLTFLTVCGYFWSWLTHICCILKGVFRSAEVGVEQQSSSTPSPHGYTAAPPRLPVAYYVPAVVLRATSSASNNHANHTNNFRSSKSNRTENNESESPPPAYEMLFPPKV